jgi:ribonuclease P protein component
VKRRLRLRDRERFRQVREEGRSWAHPILVLCALPNDLPYSRFGFTASRRVGKATVRNRARRRMREATRVRTQRVEPGWDLVLIARLPIVGSSFGEIEAACETLFRRAGLWQASP